eukprot:8840753-Pyramimonas_sp.AAC.1
MASNPRLGPQDMGGPETLAERLFSGRPWGNEKRADDGARRRSESWNEIRSGWEAKPSPGAPTAVHAAA